MMDFELLIIVASESVFEGVVGEFGADGMIAALFEPGMTVAGRALTCAVFCGTMTRADFEPASTVRADADAVGEFGGNTTPSFELYMMALPEPLPVGAGGSNTLPDLELLRNAPSDPEAVTVTVGCAAATSSDGVRGVSNGLFWTFGNGRTSAQTRSVSPADVWVTPESAVTGSATAGQ
jgi:hypothetical protein